MPTKLCVSQCRSPTPTRLLMAVLMINVRKGVLWKRVFQALEIEGILESHQWVQ